MRFSASHAVLHDGGPKTKRPGIPSRTQWKGTVGGLYDKLNEEVGEEARKALEREKKWPKDTIRLSGALRRIQGHLPYWGIGVAFGEHTKEGREVYLRRLPAVTRKSSSPSSPSSPANEIKDLAGASGRHPNVFRHPHHHPRRATALATSRVTLPVTLN